jgi:RNA polymerase sigma factor (sigma-70 family)
MEYKRIPLETVEHTEIARDRYLEFQRSMDAPDEVEIEAKWLSQRRQLNTLLKKLTPHQRKAYILRVGYELKEDQIAERLHISQAAVSKHLKAANKKLQNALRVLTDK